MAGTPYLAGRYSGKITRSMRVSAVPIFRQDHEDVAEVGFHRTHPLSHGTRPRRNEIGMRLQCSTDIIRRSGKYGRTSMARDTGYSYQGLHL